MSDTTAIVVPQSVVTEGVRMADPQGAATSPQYRLLDTMLAGKHHGLGIEHYVMNRRVDGASWARIAQDLYNDTGERVSDETLRRWFVLTEQSPP